MARTLNIRNLVRVVLMGLIILSAAGSVVWYRGLGAVDGGAPDLPVVPPMASKADMVTRDFRHVERRLNKTVWVLEASIAEIFESRARLKDVKITWYGDGDRPVVVTGRTGKVDLQSWNAVLTGNVRAVNADGAVLTTRVLEWYNNENLLKAPHPVQVHSDTLDLRGRRMEAFAREERVVFEGKVKAVVRSRTLFVPAT